MSFVKLTEDYLKLTGTAKLNYGEVILLCKIVTLSSNEERACMACNGYFADVLCTTERNIQRYLKNLKNAEVIKTYEQRKGMMTTTRYIYPQYDKIESYIEEYDKNHTPHDNSDAAHDNSDMCSSESGEPHDSFGSSTRQFVSEHTTDLVKPHDESVTPIREEKRLKENNRESESETSSDSYPASQEVATQQSKLTLYKLGELVNIRESYKLRKFLDRLDVKADEALAFLESNEEYTWESWFCDDLYLDEDDKCTYEEYFTEGYESYMEALQAS